jgi:Protein of unknown function (DUF1553)/Protein of unknown function (DUF1549)/Planctomycete cytochrome C
MPACITEPNMNRVCFAFCVFAFFTATSSMMNASEQVDFARDVQPVLSRHCSKCHSAEERNGNVSFDDHASLFVEADSGRRPIVAGKPKKSELAKRIQSTDEDVRMPPEGDRLTDDEIDLLSRWIEEGANRPDSSTTPKPTKVTSEHWSFQPISNPEPPRVADPSWPRNPIDYFIQARRESIGLRVVADAEPITFLRRASYSLTGLPPTLDEVRDFAAAAAGTSVAFDSAVENYVDELLGRTTYGERWGRHWMDWVRYADTAGDNSDYPIPQAYLYRNYIIDAFNQDLPYDRFLTEQIAGDLLPYENQEQRNRQCIATGYLAMARRFGSLIERYPWHLTIEDTIDNMGRTMLGLTVSCARCHDHKFDPITTRDYYGLYGIFASTRYPFPGIELFKTQNDFVPLLPEAEATAITEPFQQTTDSLTAEVKSLLAQCEEQKIANTAEASSTSIEEQRKSIAKLDGMLMKARKAGEKLAEHLKTLPDMPTAYAVLDSQAKNARIQMKGEPDRPGAEVPRKFLDVLGGQRLPEQRAKATSGRLELAGWITSPENPLTARVIVNRVWQRHFGTALVPSASDFGLRGEQPSHPELLDCLASEFVRSGWSLKHLHRLIMTSRTYRLASHDNEANLQLDPNNRWYWKFNRQRLDAESIRDTLLLVAGTLDPSMPTEPHPFPPQKDWQFTQHHPFKDDYASNLRSVYLMTKRLTAKPYFQTFDGPDPNVCTSDRDQSVTALQALYFVNDEFLHEQANRLAEKLLADHSNNDHRLNEAFSKILCRAPKSHEFALLQQHLVAVREVASRDKEIDRSTIEMQAWSSLVRSLLRLNEFLYLD